MIDDVLLLTQAEYARHRGVSRPAIHKIKNKLVFDQATGKIDVAASDRALGEVRERIFVRDEQQVSAATGGYVSPESSGLTKAKTATEIYRARLAQLEYEDRVSKLLRRDDVEESMRVCREVIAREAERIPMWADELAAAFRKDQLTGLRRALTVMSRKVLATLAAEMRALAATTPAKNKAQTD